MSGCGDGQLSQGVILQLLNERSMIKLETEFRRTCALLEDERFQVSCRALLRFALRRGYCGVTLPIFSEFLALQTSLRIPEWQTVLEAAVGALLHGIVGGDPRAWDEGNPAGDVVRFNSRASPFRLYTRWNILEGVLPPESTKMPIMRLGVRPREASAPGEDEPSNFFTFDCDDAISLEVLTAEELHGLARENFTSRLIEAVAAAVAALSDIDALIGRLHRALIVGWQGLLVYDSPFLVVFGRDVTSPLHQQLLDACETLGARLEQSFGRLSLPDESLFRVSLEISKVTIWPRLESWGSSFNSLVPRPLILHDLDALLPGDPLQRLAHSDVQALLADKVQARLQLFVRFLLAHLRSLDLTAMLLDALREGYHGLLLVSSPFMPHLLGTAWGHEVEMAVYEAVGRAANEEDRPGVQSLVRVSLQFGHLRLTVDSHLLRQVFRNADLGLADTSRTLIYPLPLSPVLYAAAVMISDDYFTLTPAADCWGRLFDLAGKLPLELVMMLCQRLQGSAKTIILSDDFELGLRFLLC